MKIGDKVRFLSETGGGIVAGFQDKNIVLVEDEDGFQIPVRTNDVVVVDTDDYNIKIASERRRKRLKKTTTLLTDPSPSKPNRKSGKGETPCPYILLSYRLKAKS